MRRSWPFALVVVAVGGLAGLAIAGRPVPGDPFKLQPTGTDAEAPEETSTTSIAATTPVVDAATTTVVASAGPVPPTTSPAAATTTIAGTLPRDQVRLVIANGDGRFRLGSITADRLAPLGYPIDRSDALRTAAATVLYYRPGFDDEAKIVATDLGVPDAIVTALPTNLSQPITNSDSTGDVIVVLGPDAPR